MSVASIRPVKVMVGPQLLLRDRDDRDGRRRGGRGRRRLLALAAARKGQRQRHANGDDAGALLLSHRTSPGVRTEANRKQWTPMRPAVQYGCTWSRHRAGFKVCDWHNTSCARTICSRIPGAAFTLHRIESSCRSGVVRRLDSAGLFLLRIEAGIGSGLKMAFAAAAERNDSGIALSIAVLKQRFGERLSTSGAMREQHGHTTSWIPNQPPDAVIFVENADEVRRDRARLRRASHARHRLRHRHVAGGAPQRAGRRHLRRPLAHEPHRRRPRRRSRLRGGAGRHAQAAEYAPARRRDCSSRSTPAPTRASAAWRRRAPPAPTRCATAR